MAKKVDANQPDIVAVLRAVGATVQDIHAIGQGCPDILVGFGHSNYLMEIKGLRGKLTGDEADWHAEWRGQVVIVRSADEALRIIGAEVMDSRKGGV